MDVGEDGGGGRPPARRATPSGVLEIVAAWFALAVFVFCVVVYAAGQGLAALRMRPGDRAQPSWPAAMRPRSLPEPRLRTASVIRPVPIIQRKPDRYHHRP